MSNNRITIDEWVKSNPEIEKLLVEIQEMPISEKEQAQVAFDRLAELLKLPKMPEDMIRNVDNEEAQRSLFEEHALLKFLEPEDDPRGVVLLSVFHVLHSVGVDYEDVAEKQYPDGIPENCLIGIRGEGIDSEVIFPKELGKGWHDLGCKLAVKI